jgi:magnesium transporter
MIDSIVDSYYYTLEKISDRIESLEDEIHDNPSKNEHRSIQVLKRELILLRKSVYPLREAIGKLNKEDDLLISKETNFYLSDVYDHCIQIIDSIETFRDLASSLMDLYMTSMSNKMNEVMKVLTIISTIFIPITFIAGIYGMNFQYIPELTHQWGYPITLAFMGLLVLIMIIYFKVKKWF